MPIKQLRGNNKWAVREVWNSMERPRLEAVFAVTNGEEMIKRTSMYRKERRPV